MKKTERVRPAKTGIRAPLGDLEMRVMRYVWQCEPKGCLAAELRDALAHAGNALALTTILTTLERLYSKQILTRERDGKAYRYHAALSEADLQQRIVSGVLNDLIARFPDAVALYFARSAPGIKAADAAELAGLAARLAVLRATQNREGDGGENP